MEEKLQQKTDDREKKAVKLSNKSFEQLRSHPNAKRLWRRNLWKMWFNALEQKKLLAKLRESGEA